MLAHQSGKRLGVLPSHNRCTGRPDAARRRASSRGDGCRLGLRVHGRSDCTGMLPAAHSNPTSGEPIMPAVPLTLGEREEIRAGIERDESITAIATSLARHRCTVTAEIARNGGRDAYRAVDAQARADVQRARPKTPILVARPDLAAHVEGRLRAKDSPMTIAVELARGIYPGVEGAVSNESIYAAVYAHGRRGLAKGLHVGLHRRRRCRKRQVPKSEQPQAKSPLGQFNPIASRPAVAAGRAEVGHLEGDLIIGAGGRSAIATVFDRASRHCWLADLPDDQWSGVHPGWTGRADRPHPLSTPADAHLGPGTRDGPLGRPDQAVRHRRVLR